MDRDAKVKEDGVFALTDYPSPSRSNPQGLRAVLGAIRRRYNNIQVMITGNGVKDEAGDLNDNFRSAFISQHVDEVLKGELMVRLTSKSCLLLQALTGVTMVV